MRDRHEGTEDQMTIIAIVLGVIGTLGTVSLLALGKIKSWEGR
jgi:hypothetical protein